MSSLQALSIQIEASTHTCSHSDKISSLSPYFLPTLSQDIKITRETKLSTNLTINFIEITTLNYGKQEISSKFFKNLIYKLQTSSLLRSLNLDFSPISELSTNRLYMISKLLKNYLPSLKNLKLTFDSYSIDHAGRNHFIQCFKKFSSNIKNLDFDFGASPSFTAKNREAFMSSLKVYSLWLKSLNLNLRAISFDQTHLYKTLNYNNGSIKHLALNFRGQEIDSKKHLFIRALINLKDSLEKISLNCSTTDISDELLKRLIDALVHFSMLRNLDLGFHDCKNLTDVGMKYFSDEIVNLPTSLRSLILDLGHLGSDLTFKKHFTSGLNSLLGRLEVLNLNLQGWIPKSASSLMDFENLLANEGSKLSELNLDLTYHYDQNLDFKSKRSFFYNLFNSAVGFHPSLQTLKLDFMDFSYEFQEDFCKFLLKLQVLENLALKFETFGSVKALAPAFEHLLPNLHSLDIDFRRCRSQGDEELGIISNLIRERGIKLKNLTLNFSWNKITNVDDLKEALKIRASTLKKVKIILVGCLEIDTTQIRSFKDYFGTIKLQEKYLKV